MDGWISVVLTQITLRPYGRSATTLSPFYTIRLTIFSVIYGRERFLLLQVLVNLKLRCISGRSHKYTADSQHFLTELSHQLKSTSSTMSNRDYYGDYTPENLSSQDKPQQMSSMQNSEFVPGQVRSSSFCASIQLLIIWHCPDPRTTNERTKVLQSTKSMEGI
jgi:hypothetical protein